MTANPTRHREFIEACKLHEDYSVVFCYPDTGEPYHTYVPSCTYRQGLDHLRVLLDKHSADEVSIINNTTGRHMSWVLR